MDLQQGCKRVPIQQWPSNNIRTKYKILSQVGQGTYGKVYKAQERSNPNNVVALKKIDESKETYGFPMTALREIKYINQTQHRNVIKLIEVVTEQEQENQKGSTFLVFEYLEHDLSGLMRMKYKFPLPQLKNMMHQLLTGLKFIHSKNIIHRDLKFDNILYSNSGDLKIADFGLAKLKTNCQMTNRVQSLKYMSPEILFGCRNYSSKIDIWSTAIMFAELILKQQLFHNQTNCYASQFDQISKILGNPEQDWKEVTSLPSYHEIQKTKPESKYRTRNLKKYLKKIRNNLEDNIIDLLDKMLVYNPDKRYSAEECLNHPFFSDYPPIADIDEMPKFDDEYKKMKTSQQQQKEVQKQMQKQQQHQIQQQQQIYQGMNQNQKQFQRNGNHSNNNPMNGNSRNKSSNGYNKNNQKQFHKQNNDLSKSGRNKQGRSRENHHHFHNAKKFNHQNNSNKQQHYIPNQNNYNQNIQANIVYNQYINYTNVQAPNNDQNPQANAPPPQSPQFYQAQFTATFPMTPQQYSQQTPPIGPQHNKYMSNSNYQSNNRNFKGSGQNFHKNWNNNQNNNRGNNSQIKNQQGKNEQQLGLKTPLLKEFVKQHINSQDKRKKSLSPTMRNQNILTIDSVLERKISQDSTTHSTNNTIVLTNKNNKSTGKFLNNMNNEFKLEPVRKKRSSYNSNNTQKNSEFDISQASPSLKRKFSQQQQQEDFSLNSPQISDHISKKLKSKENSVNLYGKEGGNLSQFSLNGLNNNENSQNNYFNVNFEEEKQNQQQQQDLQIGQQKQQQHQQI